MANERSLQQATEHVQNLHTLDKREDFQCDNVCVSVRVCVSVCVCVCVLESVFVCCD